MTPLTKIVIGISLSLVFMFIMNSPLLAESRSATVRVSCTILPMIEVSTPDLTPRAELGIVSDNGLISVRTNLGKNYSLAEVSRKTSEGLLKLYSVTAL